MPASRAARRRNYGYYAASAMTLQLRRYNVADPTTSVNCFVNYAGNDVYEVTMNGETFRFLSREAAAVYISLMVGEASFFDYELLMGQTWSPHFSAVQAQCDEWVIKRLLLLLRDARRY